jgi:hypothetical protein
MSGWRVFPWMERMGCIRGMCKLFMKGRPIACQKPHEANKNFLLIWTTTLSITQTPTDVLPSSLIDSNVNLRWRQWKNKKLGHAFWPGLGRSHHLPPYIILCAWPQDQHPNDIFVSRLPSGSLEILKVGSLTTLGAHNFVCIPSIEMRSREKL